MTDYASVEANVLISLVRLPEERKKILGSVKEYYFKDDANKVLFRVISGLINQNLAKDDSSFFDAGLIKKYFKSDYDAYFVEYPNRVMLASNWSKEISDTSLKVLLHDNLIMDTTKQIENYLNEIKANPRDPKEISETLKSISANIDSHYKKTDYSKYIMQIDEFVSSIQGNKLKPLFGNLINEGELIFLFGQQGIGKTPFVFDFASKIAKGGGGEYFDEKLPTEPKRVLIAQLELRAHHLNHRIADVKFGTENLFIIRLDELFKDGVDVVLQVILDMAKDFDVIILDNYTALADSQNMIKPEEATAMLKRVRKVVLNDPSKTIIVVMHTPKQFQTKGLIESSHLEGSHKLSGLADGLIGIGRGDDFLYLRNLKYRSSKNTDTVKTFKTEKDEGKRNLGITYLGEIDATEVKANDSTGDKASKPKNNYFTALKEVLAGKPALRHADIKQLLIDKKGLTPSNADSYIMRGKKQEIIIQPPGADGKYILNYDFDKDYTF